MNRNKAELDSLYCFQDTMRYGSFSKAADMMDSTVIQLKKKIAQLEEDLNITFFVPGSEGKVPTAAGLFFYDKLESVLSNLETSIVQTKNVASEKPLKLSIAISDMFRPSIYSELIWRFSKEHPEVELKLSAPFWSDMRRRLIDGTVDLGLTYTGGLDEEPLLIRKTIFKSCPYLVYEEKLFDGQSLPTCLEDFKDHVFVCHEKDEIIKSQLDILPFEPKKIILVDSLKTLQLYVQSGIAFAICGPAQQIAEISGIRKLDIESRKDMGGADLLWDDNNQNPARELFLECADRVFGLK